MGFWEAAVLIVAIVVIGKVMSGGRWNKETRRWERYSADNPYVKQGLLDDNARLAKDVAKLNERVTNLERIATEPGRQLADEIERLRHAPAPLPDRPAPPTH